MGLAYFAFLGRIFFGGGMDDFPKNGVEMAQTFAPLLLLVFAVGWWVSGRTHMSLAFSPPEAQFLFQAPMTRRTLLQFKLLKAQLGLIPFAIIMGVMMSRLFPLSFVPALIAAWVLLTTLHLHQVGTGLIRTAWTSQGSGGVRRMWVPLVAVVLGGAALLWAFLPVVAAFGTASSLSDFYWAVDRAVWSRLAVAALLPFHIALGALLAPNLGAWWPALAGALALLAAHYLWVARVDAAFEEVAAEAGLELQAIATAFKEGRLGILMASKGKRMRRPWFRLRPTGHPAMGIFWKGLTGFTRSFGISQVMSLVITFFGFWVALMFLTENAREASLAAATMPTMCVGLALFMGPVFLRHDLRSDLQRQEIIRTLPIPGRDLVAAEIASTAAALTLIAAFFSLIAFVFLSVATLKPPTDWRMWLALVAVLGMLPLISGIVAGAHNALAVVFPGWVKFGPTQSQGIDQMGTVMVTVLTTGVFVIVGLIGPAVVGGTIAMRTVSVLGPWTVVPVYAGAWLTMVAELILLAVLLGDAYEEMDPSAEGLLG